jgi:hypothetical protein
MKKSVPKVQKILLVTYVLAIIWTSITHTIESRATGNPIHPSLSLLKSTSAPRTRSNVRAYVQSASKAAGVNPRISEWIVSHESSQRPEATGDGGDSRGLWQINKTWHPEVPDACAYDVSCSTHWSLERIRDGYVDEWSTWKYCRERFEDCPF